MPRRHLQQLGLTGRRAKGDPGGLAFDRGYPRPMLRRESWQSLDGLWDFAIDPPGQCRLPREVVFDAKILVPFSPETRRSGIGDGGLYRCCWYRREFTVAQELEDQRTIIHFGAVDYRATVWIDGHMVARHEGGYTPFEADITDVLGPGAVHEVVVRAEDDPADLAKPRGKQDWQLEPHSIWYPRTTGIWQSVWLENVPRHRIRELRWTPNLERWEIGLDARLSTPHSVPYELRARLHVGDIMLIDDRYTVMMGELHRRLGLSDPGIDDFRNELLWSPTTPTLVDVDLELADESGHIVDRVTSYTALRSFERDAERFVLNGRPYLLKMVLDQGYWPDTGLTAPDDAALRRDVELTKAMGFNGARKHQKVEDPRYLYWADRLGLLVWSEMPSAYRFTVESVAQLTRQWMEVIRRDVSHPSIVAWVPFNESWGVPNLPTSKTERHYIEGLYHLTRTLDPTRPVVGNDGWESAATDVIGIHDYDDEPERIARRYATYDLLPKILKRERPGGRALVLEPSEKLKEVPIVLSEFGGIAYADDAQQTWGYSRCATPEELAERYRRLLTTVQRLELFAGFCYTQLTDTYQEANGLLYADRTPKIPLEQIAAATAGPREPQPEQRTPTTPPPRSEP